MVEPRESVREFAASRAPRNPRRARGCATVSSGLSVESRGRKNGPAAKQSRSR
jgi:hypothetical protein